METQALKDSKKSSGTFLCHADAPTAECSPINLIDKSPNLQRLGSRSKFSKSLIHSSKLDFSQLGMDETNGSNDNEVACLTDFKVNSRNIRSSMRFQEELKKVKVFYLIPQELVGTLSKSSKTLTVKNGFLIDYVYVDFNIEFRVDDLIKAAIKEINAQNRLIDYSFAETNECFSMRTNKRSGFPDFDLPGNLCFNI